MARARNRARGCSIEQNIPSNTIILHLSSICTMKGATKQLESTLGHKGATPIGFLIAGALIDSVVQGKDLVSTYQDLTKYHAEKSTRRSRRTIDIQDDEITAATTGSTPCPSEDDAMNVGESKSFVTKMPSVTEEEVEDLKHTEASSPQNKKLVLPIPPTNFVKFTPSTAGGSSSSSYSITQNDSKTLTKATPTKVGTPIMAMASVDDSMEKRMDSKEEIIAAVVSATNVASSVDGLKAQDCDTNNARAKKTKRPTNSHLENHGEPREQMVEMKTVLDDEKNSSINTKNTTTPKKKKKRAFNPAKLLRKFNAATKRLHQPRKTTKKEMTTKGQETNDVDHSGNERILVVVPSSSQSMASSSAHSSESEAQPIFDTLVDLLAEEIEEVDFFQCAGFEAAHSGSTSFGSVATSVYTSGHTSAATSLGGYQTSEADDMTEFTKNSSYSSQS